MSTSSTSFNGSSSFSSDFQAVITRSVQIASLPLNQMQTSLNTMNSRSSALTSLDSQFSALQTAVSNLSKATGLGSYAASVADSTIASASVSSGVQAGSYTIKVLNLGSYTNTMGTQPGVYVSTASVSDPATQSISTASQFQLSVNGVSKYTITPAGGSLQNLVDAINSTASSDVTASVTTLSGGGSALKLTARNSANVLTLSHDDGSGGQQAVTLGEAASLVSNPATQTMASPAQFNLSIDGQVKYTITPSGTSLSSLVNDINQTAGADVHASLVNVGSSSSPDYRLSIQMNQLAASTIQLSYTDANGTQQNVVDQLSLGAQAQYQVNGSSITSTSNSRSITLAPGLAVQLQGQTATGAAATNITISRNTSAISNALGSFVSAYNATVTALNQNRGSNNGALSGNGIVTSLSQALNQLTSYSTGNSGVSSLTALGLTFDDKGVLSYDSTVFTAATGGNMDTLLSFLGDSSTGGFLKSATDLLNGVEDPVSGMLKTEEQSVQNQITKQNNLISDEQTRIDALTQTLQNQMAAADALVASLQQQVSYLTNMFSAMQTASNSMK